MTDIESVSNLFFLDTNIILECKNLTDLPWEELATQGTILALVTRTAMKEIDSKKGDGRLGKFAREFNRLIAPIAIGGEPIVIRNSVPKVLLGLSKSNQIDWKVLHALDPDEPDHKIAAEAAYAKEMPNVPRTLISHDILPLSAATDAGLKAFRISDNWLRQMQPSAKEKEMQRLKNKVSMYEKSEPAFEIGLQLKDNDSPSLVKLSELTQSERRDLISEILRKNPKKNLGSSSLPSVSIHDYDSSYAERYAEWRSEKVPAFIENYERSISMVYNQVWFSIKIKNKGKVQAESLRVDVTINNGWFNKKPTLISPRGPTSPSPQSRLHGLHNFHNNVPDKTPRHSFAFMQKPNRSQSFVVTCEDFRHGHNWTFDGVIGLDAYSSSPTAINVEVTAANFHGTEKLTKLVDWTVEEHSFDELIERESLFFKRPTILDPFIESRNLNAIDLIKDD